MAEASTWLRFADESLRTAELCLDSGLLNPCLQNAQQAVEKALKAALAGAGIAPRKTHGVAALRDALHRATGRAPLDADEADLLDSVYLPSKYPLDEALPAFEPDLELATRCLDVARHVVASVRSDSTERSDTR